jgi:hypothetical protein
MAVTLTTLAVTYPGEPVPAPPTLRLVIVLLWVLAPLLIASGVGAVMAVGVSGEVRRRWYAVVPLLAAGVISLYLGCALLVDLI